jgi:hypothetical protein
MKAGMFIVISVVKEVIQLFHILENIHRHGCKPGLGY